ncbi:MAG TPA: helix-turn-helix transcriptional regulator [Ferruginibacter sp.]|jgi:DNA-binding Xre family transcriptional regulator|nr:helix-turn-helix transcriptional regulator [Ferruginibacter sp.]
MTKINFLDSSTIQVIANDGEKFILKSHLPVHYTRQKSIAQALAKNFNENFSDDKSSMVYWVLMKMLADEGFGFSYESSDRSADRERIGAKIRLLRESKGMEAKQLAMLANIDAANLSRIEQGRYSVGFDILTKISQALGVKVDLV